MRAKQVLARILAKTRGSRQITLAGPWGAQTWDVSENGEVGYHAVHRTLFYAKLNILLQQRENGGLIVKEFTDLRVQVTSAAGHTRWLPVKNVYGFAFCNGRFVSNCAALLKQCFETDNRTGKPLPPDSTLVYKEALFWTTNPRSASRFATAPKVHTFFQQSVPLLNVRGPPFLYCAVIYPVA